MLKTSKLNQGINWIKDLIDQREIKDLLSPANSRSLVEDIQNIWRAISDEDKSKSLKRSYSTGVRKASNKIKIATVWVDNQNGTYTWDQKQRDKVYQINSAEKGPNSHQ